jgi:hypothetical protein
MDFGISGTDDEEEDDDDDDADNDKEKSADILSRQKVKGDVVGESWSRL